MRHGIAGHGNPGTTIMPIQEPSPLGGRTTKSTACANLGAEPRSRRVRCVEREAAGRKSPIATCSAHTWTCRAPCGTGQRLRGVQLRSLRKITHERGGRSQKVLFGLHDGYAVESVLIRRRDGHTACISSQVGASNSFKISVFPSRLIITCAFE